MEKIKKEWNEFKILLKSVPSMLIILFIIAVIGMNLLANKSIDLHTPYLALDCGILISWLSFLTMDIITKHFGPKAATEISILAIVINLLFCLLLYIGSIIPGIWGESSSIDSTVNNALDATFGGTWYVLLGSTTAFIVSALVNNFTNYALGKAFYKHPNSLRAYAVRSYVSTALGQFVDNLLFALIVSHIFFGWSIIACVTCSLTGMLIELLCEILFSYFGFNLTKKWAENKVGLEYLQLRGNYNESLKNRNI